MHIVIALLCIGFLIFIHELGHFLAARIFKVQVNRFAIGFPPKIISFTRKGIVYALNAIPLGGYVSIRGFGAISEEAEDVASASGAIGFSYQQVSFIRQIGIVLAGIFANFLFGYIVFTCLFIKGFTVPISQVDEQMMPYVQNPTVQIAGVVEKSPAQIAGLKFNDRILSITDANQKRVALSTQSIRDALATSGGPLTFSVMRDGEKHSVVVVSEKDAEGAYRVGVIIDTYGTIKASVPKSFYLGAIYLDVTVREIFNGIGMLFKSIVSPQAREGISVSGPLGIIRDTGSLVSYGIEYLAWYIAMLSVNLAVLNILPIPPLDGWHALRAVYKKITKRDLPAKIESVITIIGMVLLFGLIIFATIGDIKSFF